MTTEEMNRVIAEYMGYRVYSLSDIHGDDDIDYVTINDYPYSLKELKYNISWDWLMPVWQKLRGELTQTKEMYKLRYNIENAIITCNITTAHRLMVEAINLIKK